MEAALHAILLGLLFGHAADAVSHREWRPLCVPRAMPENDAERRFTPIQVPPFSAVPWALLGTGERAGAWARAGVAAVRIVHAGPHPRLAGHPRSEFRGPLSPGLIHGGAILGVLSLLAAAT